MRGRVRITRNGGIIGELAAGQIVGSALLLSGAAADVEAVTMEATRALRWTAKTLEEYLNAHPDIRNEFQKHLSRDFAAKVQRLSKT